MTITNLTTVILAHQLTPEFERCLKSVASSENILLLWNGKQSELKQLTLPKQATVVTHEKPITDFAAVRNLALRHVTTEWCLMIDSDEVVPPETWSVWHQEIESGKADGFFIRRFDYFADKKVQWGELKNQWLLRLFKTKLTHFERPVHEVAVVNGESTKSKGSINHYAHKTLNEFVRDVSRYAQLEARDRFNHQKKWSWLETAIFPVGKFLYNFFWNQAWRDGFPGIIYAVMMSAHSLWVRVYLYELHQQTNH